MFENLTSRTPLPSLNALRAFEAMARTGSATQAGAELNVTHSAISRQVKSLEAQLGLPLFEGPRHALKLTATGAALLPDLSKAFEDITHAIEAVRGEGQDLHIAVNSSLAVKWLIPRLPDFYRQHPHIHLHLVELGPDAHSHRGADLLVRLVDGAAIKASKAIPLMLNRFGPVMAPAPEVADLRHACLHAPRLVSRTHEAGWSRWAKGQGLDLPRVKARPVAHLHYALDAALSGWGAAVLPWVLVAEAVQEGRLIAPFGFANDDGAVCVIPGKGPETGARRHFTQWLKLQAKSLPAPPEIAAP